jgi:hypothetical protein
MNNTAASELKKLQGMLLALFMYNITLSSLIKIVFHDHDKTFSLNLFSYARSEIVQTEVANMYNAVVCVT